MRFFSHGLTIFGSEKTVAAGIDVKADMIVPIHWASFTLATHAWTDPIERVTKEANKLGLPIATPKIGEPIILGQSNIPKSEWWKQFQ